MLVSVWYIKMLQCFNCLLIQLVVYVDTCVYIHIYICMYVCMYVCISVSARTSATAFLAHVRGAAMVRSLASSDSSDSDATSLSSISGGSSDESAGAAVRRERADQLNAERHRERTPSNGLSGVWWPSSAKWPWLTNFKRTAKATGKCLAGSAGSPGKDKANRWTTCCSWFVPNWCPSGQKDFCKTRSCCNNCVRHPYRRMTIPGSTRIKWEIRGALPGTAWNRGPSWLLQQSMAPRLRTKEPTTFLQRSIAAAGGNLYRDVILLVWPLFTDQDRLEFQMWYYNHDGAGVQPDVPEQHPLLVQRPPP